MKEPVPLAIARRDPETVEEAKGHARHLAHGPPINRVVSTVVLVVVVALIPWEVFLGSSLPRRYDARHWNTLWVGFDAFLIIVLAYTAWAFWYRRQLAIVTASIAGTLLLCDAWFDVLTSFGNRDQYVTILTAVGGEIPLAIFFFWVAWRIMRRSVAAFYACVGNTGPPPRLRDAPVFFAVTALAPTTSDGDRDRSGDPARELEHKAPPEPGHET